MIITSIRTNLRRIRSNLISATLTVSDFDNQGKSLSVVGNGLLFSYCRRLTLLI